MIGYIVSSEDDELCFVRLDGHAEDVTTFRYSKGMRVANLIMQDGREEPVSVEMAPPIHELMLVNSDILIVDMKGDDILREYTVPLRVGY